MGSSELGSCTAPGLAAGEVKRSRASKWRAWVLIGVHVLAAIHIAHWWSTGSSLSPLEPSEAKEFAERSLLNAGFVFFALLIGSTLILGRWFCGWACHLVALQDLCRALMLKIGITPRPLRSRLLAFVPFLAAGYLYFWPFVERHLKEVGPLETHTEFVVDDFWATFPGPVVALLTFLVCGFACVYFLGAKGFCTYACPYGAFFGVADKLAPGRIRVTDACEGCGHCTRVCSSNVDVAREVRDHKMVIDTGCMKCMDCVSVCPKDALYFGFGSPFSGEKRKPRKSPLGWVEELWLALMFGVCFLIVRGLYGSVPFLFALGLAGVCAFLLLKGLQLVTKPKVKLLDSELKTAGARTGKGTRFALLLLVLLGLLGHSAYVQWQGNRAEASFEELHGMRRDWFLGAAPLTEGPLKERAEDTIRYSSAALGWGLVDDARRRVERGWSRMMLGDSVGFREDLVAARALEFKPGELSIELGHEARVRKSVQECWEHYVAALDSLPRHAEVQQIVLQYAFEQNRVPQAKQVFEELSARHPQDPGLLEGLAITSAETGQIERGIECFERALLLDPSRTRLRGDIATLWKRLAAQRLNAGDEAGAREAEQRAAAASN